MKTNRRAFLKTVALARLPSWAGHTTTDIALSEANVAKQLTQRVGTGGFSQARLARMHDVMAAHVASGRVSGLVTLVSRRGETHVDVIGMKAFGGTDPMRRDTIFRIASLTKPVTAAAAMILVEETKLRLDDPVDPLLPELANRKALRSIDSALNDYATSNIKSIPNNFQKERRRDHETNRPVSVVRQRGRGSNELLHLGFQSLTEQKWKFQDY